MACVDIHLRDKLTMEKSHVSKQAWRTLEIVIPNGYGGYGRAVARLRTVLSDYTSAKMQKEGAALAYVIKDASSNRFCSSRE
jgi:transposase